MIKKEIILKKQKKLKVGKIKEAKEISKIILKIISENYQNKSGRIFKI